MNKNLRSNRFLLTQLLLSCLIFTQFCAYAAPFSLEYQGFYQRLKKVNKGHFQLVEVAFLVPNKDKCRILSGNIATENNTYPLAYSDAQQLYIPYDPKLKSNRALINMDIEGESKDCSLMMQVRVKTPKLSYDAAEVQQIQTEMDTLLSDMQGFPMRYFSDPISGLNVEFNEPTQVSIDGIEVYVGQKYHLGHKEVEQFSRIYFSHKPKLISPWIEANVQ
ncbi:DUF2987 domain-containing protein [Shewanella surugensis]|uniref:DUF2987 domain-containing protein n=1 Tax=Shewanella surugensis TaxID=212020 RepID=A0ABT0L7T1_9GAMM|nr:DUF2987 domain-containing protein [Shewanella surugensis]MCL1123753.1 DUF2987 domain-containing protein [Shewanella surugensis]